MQTVEYFEFFYLKLTKIFGLLLKLSCILACLQAENTEVNYKLVI